VVTQVFKELDIYNLGGGGMDDAHANQALMNEEFG
jgi:hypothetical protein